VHAKVPPPVFLNRKPDRQVKQRLYRFPHWLYHAIKPHVAARPRMATISRTAGI
jgi:hypothetical protein